MPLNGDVRTFSLPAIVRMIHAEKKTGLLKVASQNRRCHIYFRGGKIIFVSGNSDRELRLGSLLRANDLITEEKLEEMLTVAQAMEKRLGIVLIERGYISRDDLARILLYQFKEVITKTLTLNEAEFTYADGLDGFVEDVRCELDPIRLVEEARKWQDFRGLIPNDQVIFQIKPGATGSKSIHAARELRILLLLDGKRSVEQIIKETSYSRLAVYRSLTNLYSQGVIARKGPPGNTAEVYRLEFPSIISLYLGLLQLISADITSELGGNMAASSLENSLRQSDYYGQFLRVFRLDQDVAKNIGQIQAHVQKQGQAIEAKDLIRGFNQVIAGLLREQYRFLGPKATKSTVQRLRDTLAQVPERQRVLAKSMSRLLGQYADEQLAPTATKPSSHTPIEARSANEAGSSPLNLEKLGEGTIIAFYNTMFHQVMVELEQEVGAKAWDLFLTIVQKSKYYSSLLSKFELRSVSGSRVLDIHEHLKSTEGGLPKHDVVRAFQEVLMSLLSEEQRFLGSRATNLTISRLREAMAGTQRQLRPLANHLSAYLASNADKIE